MKKLWSKNLIIGVLVTINVAASAYIFGKKLHLRSAIAKLFAVDRSSDKLGTEIPKLRGEVASNATFKYENELQFCYESFLTREHDVDEGSVLFHWTLTAAGEINEPTLEQSDFSDRDFTSCLTDKLKTMRVPASAESAKAPLGTIIAHRFKFKRKNLDRAEFH